VFRYTFDFSFYSDCCTEIGQGRNEDNYAHRLTGGYQGLIGKKVILQAMAGWGFGYYRDDPNGPSFNSVIGDVGFSYYPTLRSLIHISGFRQFKDSLWGNYYVDNGGRLKFQHTFRWRMIGDVGGSVFARTFHGLPEPGVEDVEIDQYNGNGAADLQMRTTMATVDAGIEQPFGRLLSLAVRYNLLVNASNFEVTYTDGFTNYLGSVRHLAWILFAVRI
jgi:hypothetical protein